MDLDDEELKATRKMNGSDKNVGSIEEDIKQLEDLILDRKSFVIGDKEHDEIYIKDIQAIEHLIETYKELEEKYYYEKNRARAELDTVYIKARYDERDKWTSKIKEKIEELNNRIEKYREYAEQGIETDVEWVDNVADRKTVKVLQELLEKRK